MKNKIQKAIAILELIFLTLADITRFKKEESLKEQENQGFAFIAYVSHELKNPLAIIRDSLSMIVEGLFGQINREQQMLLETAQRNIDRLIRLTTDLLDMAKIKAGKMELKREEIAISLLIDEIITDYNREISKKKLTIKKEIPENIGLLWADKDKMTEVIVNLLNNAIKYTQPGGNITIKLFNTGNEIGFEISDTGEGIAKSDIVKLFNKFERIHAEKKEGTGLGLAITKDIVELHKGKIWVESELGRGSKFILLLPNEP